jgi:hypothetical protein
LPELAELLETVETILAFALTTNILGLLLFEEDSELEPLKSFSLTSPQEIEASEYKHKTITSLSLFFLNSSFIILPKVNLTKHLLNKQNESSL